jgi:hypothetical protein
MRAVKLFWRWYCCRLAGGHLYFPPEIGGGPCVRCGSAPEREESAYVRSPRSGTATSE